MSPPMRLALFWPVFVNWPVPARCHSNWFPWGRTQCGNSTSTRQGPQSVFPLTSLQVPHTSTYLMGTLRYTIHSGKIWARYLENLICSSFCPCTNQIICKAQKKRGFVLFSGWFPRQLLTWVPGLKTHSYKRRVKVCKNEAGLSQQVCPNTSRAPCRGGCSLLWKQGGPLLLCCLLAALICSSTASSWHSFLFGDGA